MPTPVLSQNPQEFPLSEFTLLSLTDPSEEQRDLIELINSAEKFYSESQTQAVSIDNCEEHAGYRLNKYCPSIPAVIQEKELSAAHEKLDQIGSLKTNWDDEGAKKPTAIVVRKARTFLELAYNVGNSMKVWTSPAVIAPVPDGRVYLSWWHGESKKMKTASVYVDSDKIICLRTWGQSLESKIDAVPIVLREDPIREYIWQWLVQP